MSTTHTATILLNGIETWLDIYKLRPHASSLPRKTVSLESLQSFVADTEANKRWGEEKGKRFGPALIMSIIADNDIDDIYKEHIIRICEADLSFPIWMFQGQIVDGLHRLTKAFIQGEKEILLQEWTVIPEDAIVKNS